MADRTRGNPCSPGHVRPRRPADAASLAANCSGPLARPELGPGENDATLAAKDGHSAAISSDEVRTILTGDLQAFFEAA